MHGTKAKHSSLDKIVLAASLAMITDVLIMPSWTELSLLKEFAVHRMYSINTPSMYRNIGALSAELLGIYYLIKRSYLGNRM